ncbi:putative glycine dehydrogenase (decarboxylating) subunit 2 [Methylobrevis pamukkalensis]|uniref:Putative glycine dehydrogenase (Decarboxylating) subunit 2 n=1 Tax=Methylobrevis pamukkalensis TaxID=1439726 RepID=A0A1E3H4Z8_9HYPH|nr:putative glycine dehydrogenase (decarboxylating) subunit 2 [Methylobrevis pamukkalensis]
MSGVDIEAPLDVAPRLGRHRRKAPLDLPGLSEPETMRHYVRLSRRNYAIDLGVYPLGSCTMKHNPRLNEKMARLPGFATCIRFSRSPPFPARSTLSPNAAAGCWR